MRTVPYPHPGEILQEEFLKPMGISQYRLAKEIHVPQRRIGEIVAGTRGISVDTGLRLSRFFGTSDGFWTGLQLDHEMEMAKDTLAATLADITPRLRQSPAHQSRLCSNLRPQRLHHRHRPTGQPPPARWYDFLTHYFQCTHCKAVFEIDAETYHGRGGEWKMLEVAAKRFQAT